MTDAEDYENEMWSVVESFAPNRELHLEWNTPKEAKLRKSEIIQVQKRLRLIKKEISLHIKTLNAEFTSDKAKVGKSVGSDLFSSLFGRRLSGRSNAIARDNIRRQQLNAVGPYQTVSQKIDQVLDQFDRIKLQIDKWIIENQKE